MLSRRSVATADAPNTPTRRMYDVVGTQLKRLEDSVSKRKALPREKTKLEILEEGGCANS